MFYLHSLFRSSQSEAGIIPYPYFTDSEKWGQGGVTCSATHLVSEELKQSCLVASSYGILLQKGRGTVAPEESTYQCGSCSTFVR